MVSFRDFDDLAPAQGHILRAIARSKQGFESKRSFLRRTCIADRTADADSGQVRKVPADVSSPDRLAVGFPRAILGRASQEIVRDAQYLESRELSKLAPIV